MVKINNIVLEVNSIKILKMKIIEERFIKR